MKNIPMNTPYQVSSAAFRDMQRQKREQDARDNTTEALAEKAANDNARAEIFAARVYSAEGQLVYAGDKPAKDMLSRFLTD